MQYKIKFDNVKKWLSLCRDGYIWFLLTCLFALLFPIWMKLAMPSFNYSLGQFFSDGDLVLFAMTIVTSLVVDDFVFAGAVQNRLESWKRSKLERGFLLFIFPIFVIMLCLIIYLRCQALSEYCDPFTVGLEIFTFLAVTIYAAFIKQTAWETPNSPLSRYMTQSQRGS